jgi:RHS repeat-associated protein
MLTRNDSTGNFTQQWDKETRLITVTGSATGTFVYDGDGNRVKATLNGVTTAYVGNYYEQSGSVTTTYYYAGGARIAMRQGITVSYLLGDHLGSTAIAANGTTGALLSEQRYKPWGEQRYPAGASALPTRRQYTGQINDAEIGLYFYNARSYLPVIGRFLSADTIVPSPSDPQNLNRYSYVSNRPLSLADPSGHCGWDKEYGTQAQTDCETILQSLHDTYGISWEYPTDPAIKLYDKDNRFLRRWKLSDAQALQSALDAWSSALGGADAVKRQLNSGNLTFELHGAGGMDLPGAKGEYHYSDNEIWLSSISIEAIDFAHEIAHGWEGHHGWIYPDGHKEHSWIGKFPTYRTLWFALKFYQGYDSNADTWTSDGGGWTDIARGQEGR